MLFICVGARIFSSLVLDPLAHFKTLSPLDLFGIVHIFYYLVSDSQKSLATIVDLIDQETENIVVKLVARQQTTNM